MRATSAKPRTGLHIWDIDTDPGHHVRQLPAPFLCPLQASLARRLSNLSVDLRAVVQKIVDYKLHPMSGA